METNHKDRQKMSNMTAKELLTLRKQAQKDHFALKMKHAVKWLKQTHQLRVAKKNIARINTFFSIASKNLKDKSA
jgi:ribosomal protein L29